MLISNFVSMKMNTMKYSIIGFCILLSTVVLVSCDEYLMKAPETNISEEDAFENFTNFQGYTEELYNTIPDFTNAYWTNNWNFADDIVTSNDMNYHVVNYFDEGNFWGWQSENNGWGTSWMDKANASPTSTDRFEKDLWDNGWYAIRKANVGLENLDKLQGTQMEKNLIEGQLLFFRGWYYFQFMQNFGGMPYMSTPLPADAQFDQERLEYQAIADSVASDLRRAADLLPVNWDYTEPGARTSGNNDLRINKVMALGYLGKNLLWAASPLMNNGSDENVSSYDQEYAQRAANAFGELLSLVETGATDHELLPFEEWHMNFYTQGQNFALPGGSERIFTGPYYSTADQSNWGTSKQYQPTVILDGSNFFPTANTVEEYGMANGLPLDHPDSGYDPEYPWRDRDPRFYSTFVYDGLQVVQGTMPAGEEIHRHANLYTGGSYRFNNGASPGGSQTGYTLRKFVPLTANNYDLGMNYGQNLHVHLPWMRLADVYIMYAEAVAVATQSATGSASNLNMTAEDAINRIRDRASDQPGDAHVHSDYLGDVNEFLSEVRREWQVELGYERHRLTNLRRWLLLLDDRYANKTGHYFDRDENVYDPDNPTENRVQNLESEVLIERNFTQRHYWLPLKRSDVNISSSFKQNPGW